MEKTFFPSDFAFLTWVMRFSNFPIFQNIPGRSRVKYLIESFLKLTKHLFFISLFYLMHLNFDPYVLRMNKSRRWFYGKNVNNLYLKRK